MSGAINVKLDGGKTVCLRKNKDGSFSGIHRGHAFRVWKFLDTYRPRTATRWSGPQQRWTGECEYLRLEGERWRKTSRKWLVECICYDIDEKLAGIHPVFGAGVNGPSGREDVAAAADQAEMVSRLKELKQTADQCVEDILETGRKEFGA